MPRELQDSIVQQPRVQSLGATRKERRPATAPFPKSLEKFEWDPYEQELFADAADATTSTPAKRDSTTRRRRPCTAPSVPKSDGALIMESTLEPSAADARKDDKEGFVAAARELARRER